MKKYKIFSLAVMLAIVLIPTVAALADANTPIVINPNIPGSYATSSVPVESGPGVFIANFYQFALMIGGLLAFGMIVWGGVKYAASRGNPSAESDAKDRIYGALIGLLLLAGVYIILFTINPNLLNLQLPTLQNVTITASPNSGSVGSNIAPPGVGCTLGSARPSPVRGSTAKTLPVAPPILLRSPNFNAWNKRAGKTCWSPRDIRRPYTTLISATRTAVAPTSSPRREAGMRAAPRYNRSCRPRRPAGW